MRIALLVDQKTDAYAAEALSARLRAANHEPVLVGEGDGAVDADDADVDAFDALVIPSGDRHHLLTHERFLSLLRDVYARGKLVAVVHKDRWVLVPAGLSRVTWPSVKRELIMEPGNAKFADSFGVQPLVSGTAADMDGLISALAG